MIMSPTEVSILGMFDSIARYYGQECLVQLLRGDKDAAHKAALHFCKLEGHGMSTTMAKVITLEEGGLNPRYSVASIDGNEEAVCNADALIEIIRSSGSPKAKDCWRHYRLNLLRQRDSHDTPQTKRQRALFEALAQVGVNVTVAGTAQ